MIRQISVRACLLALWRNDNCVFLLLLLAVVNLPQAMVLCLGDGGHVAIEPAGHNHHSESSCLCGQDSRPPDTDDYLHLAGGTCHSCVDIPIFVGMGDHRVSSRGSNSVGIYPVNLQSAVSAEAAPDVTDTVSAVPHRPPPSCTPLRSIILQV